MLNEKKKRKCIEALLIGLQDSLSVVFPAF